MFTVALVGGDGAGKSTIAELLQTTFPHPIKYLYMGTSIQSSNVVLPTSRLILYLKQRAYRKHRAADGGEIQQKITAQDLEYQPVRRGRIGAVARLVHRVSEQWYRQFVAWSYVRRGYIVLFDRHFLFEYNPDAATTVAKTDGVADRLHRWQLRHLYPRPDLTIFLDAPADVLYARKAEWSVERLERFQQAVLEQGSTVANFVRIDGSQPIETVFAAVAEEIESFAATKMPHISSYL